jgi:hypothetical protein
VKLVKHGGSSHATVKAGLSGSVHALTRRNHFWRRIRNAPDSVRARLAAYCTIKQMMRRYILDGDYLASEFGAKQSPQRVNIEP